MPTPEAVLGTVSLITWSLIVIISVKYAVLMLRADNRGEGGIVALLAVLEPIREVWIHGEVFAVSRLSMIRIMARRKNAATVVA